MAKCIAGGGTLASVHSEAEMQETKKICGDGICYIGLARWAKDQPFTWLDGTPVDFTAWDDGQPQAEETKVVYTGPDGDKWHDWGTGADKFAGICMELAPTEADPEPQNLLPGLEGSYYFFGDEELSTMPHINGDKVPDATAVSETIGFKSHDDFKVAVPDMPHDKVAAVWNGYIKIETAGLYTFKTVSDDGSHLWIKNSMIVDNSGLHAPAAKEGVMNLAAGYFEMTADFFENGGGEYMEVMYSGPDTGGEMKLLEGFHQGKAECDERLLGEKGSGYRGCQDKTISGKVCQKWTSQSPHKHERTPEKYPGKGLGDHNQCRNPDGTDNIWLVPCNTEPGTCTLCPLHLPPSAASST